MQILKQTTSLCPQCLRSVPATVLRVGEEIQLHRVCPEHGAFAAVINSSERFYYLSVGAQGNVDRGGASQKGPADGLPILSPVVDVEQGENCCSAGCGGVDHLSTCIALIEIVSSCNLACPVCFANSPRERHVDAMEFSEFRERVLAVTKRKGKIDILQLSGGEPTIHPQFFELLEWALANPEIGHVLLNTNGVKVANSAFIQRLAELRQRFGKLEIYLQYDGPQLAGQFELRGLDMRKTRQRVIELCQEAEIPVNLAMTVDQHNRHYLGEVLQIALDAPWVSGITWQPMFGSGRVYDEFNRVAGNYSATDSSHLTMIGNASGDPTVEREKAACGESAEPQEPDVKWPTVRRLNVADIIRDVVAQSRGRLREADFTPLPCGDPNCHTVAYLIRDGDHLIGLSSLIDLPSVQGFLQDRLNFNVTDLIKCGCESEPLGQILKSLEVGPRKVLRLVIKPFMDAWTYDQHRVDRCCVHVIGPQGQLDSFCRHYALAGMKGRR